MHLPAERIWLGNKPTGTETTRKSMRRLRTNWKVTPIFDQLIATLHPYALPKTFSQIYLLNIGRNYLRVYVCVCRDQIQDDQRCKSR